MGVEGRNPYEAPRTSATEGLSKRAVDRRYASGLHLAWVIVFLLNLVTPLLFGWSRTESSGRIGMLIAAFLLLALGYGACGTARGIARPLVAGGILVAISQFFPLIQIIAGLIGMGIGSAAGQVDGRGDIGPGFVRTETGGFLVTLVTGGLLMTAALVAGAFLRIITPWHWWSDRPEGP
jgi:hypothetical protein